MTITIRYWERGGDGAGGREELSLSALRKRGLRSIGGDVAVSARTGKEKQWGEGFAPGVLTFLSLSQNYFQKLEKLSAAEEDGPKKERTKLITPQVAKLEHTYKPG